MEVVLYPVMVWTKPLSSRIVSMLFSSPALIFAALSFHSCSASATFAKYFIPIHLRDILLGPCDARSAHLAQT
jgi:hypothetical protein